MFQAIQLLSTQYPWPTLLRSLTISPSKLYKDSRYLRGSCLSFVSPLSTELLLFHFYSNKEDWCHQWWATTRCCSYFGFQFQCDRGWLRRPECYTRLFLLWIVSKFCAFRIVTLFPVQNYMTWRYIDSLQLEWAQPSLVINLFYCLFEYFVPFSVWNRPV
jgi:hypothetical protein